MDKKFLGQPVWLWVVGAVVVVGGYLYLKHKQPTPTGQPSGQRPNTAGFVSPTGWSTETFTRWIHDHQGPPHHRPRPPNHLPRPPRNPPPTGDRRLPPRQRRG